MITIDMIFVFAMYLLAVFLEGYLATYYALQIKAWHWLAQALLLTSYWAVNSTFTWLLSPANRSHISFEIKDLAFSLGVGFFCTLVVLFRSSLRPKIQRKANRRSHLGSQTRR